MFGFLRTRWALQSNLFASLSFTIFQVRRRKERNRRVKHTLHWESKHLATESQKSHDQELSLHGHRCLEREVFLSAWRIECGKIEKGGSCACAMIFPLEQPHIYTCRSWWNTWKTCIKSIRISRGPPHCVKGGSRHRETGVPYLKWSKHTI
jgi:hypothetical protein